MLSKLSLLNKDEALLALLEEWGFVGGFPALLAILGVDFVIASICVDELCCAEDEVEGEENSHSHDFNALAPFVRWEGKVRQAGSSFPR